MGEFIVARNPDASSRLPFLLYLPLENGLWLKAKEAWPRSSRVFCYPATEPRCELDLIERVPVAWCHRNGPAIDLVLERGLRKRSQFVFVLNRGRRQIYWQTPKAAQSARPGLRIPYAPPQGYTTYYIDSRERYGYSFGGLAVERRALAAGDYAVADEQGKIVSAVERKTMEDFATSLVDASLSFEMMELAALPHAAVVVEASYSQILRHDRTRRGYLPELIGRLAVLYPHVPILFLETRVVAQEWVLRFLRLAQANCRAVQLPLAMDEQAASGISASRRKVKRSSDMKGHPCPPGTT